MKIIFKNLKEQKDFLQALGEVTACPEDFKLPDVSGYEQNRKCAIDCDQCWEMALKDMMEVEGNEDDI